MIGIRSILGAAAIGVMAPGAGAAGAAGVFDYFRMPSGNIYCGYVKVSFAPTELRCEIRSHVRPLPPRPKACGDAVWGAGYSMGRLDRPSVLCITDTIYSPTARVIPYGSTYRRDVFTCLSRAAGLRCTNGAGHGFFLSREHSYSF